MGLPLLTSCCGVLDLKSGNIVMGCFNAFLSLMMMIAMIVFAVIVADTMGSLPDADVDIEVAAARTGLYVMTLILVLMYVAKFVSDVIFVYAVIVERAFIIKVCILMWMVFYLLSMFTFFINVTNYDAWTVVFEIFYIAINVYAILLARSFYKIINEREVI